MVAKDLHAWLGVRVKRRLEPYVGDADLLEKGFYDANEVAEAQVAVGYETLALMKLAEMRGVHRFVAEHFV